MNRSQNSRLENNVRRSCLMDFARGCSAASRASTLGAGGVGGRAGMKNEGIVAAVAMMLTQRIEDGTSEGLDTQKGVISWPNAAPKGLAREATAVAAVRPLGLNQTSEYVVGAERTKG